MKINLLFLDIDSVLNHFVQAEDLYTSDFISTSLVKDNVPICQDNLDALKYIVDNVENLRIVWSTGWRYFEQDTYMKWKNPRKYLENLDWLKDLFIGKTPQKMSSNRFEEIHFWFTDNHINQLRHKPVIDIANYVILDDYDDAGMKRYGEHFFRTDWNTGLTLEQAENIVKFFKTENFNYKELDWRIHG